VSIGDEGEKRCAGCTGASRPDLDLTLVRDPARWVEDVAARCWAHWSATIDAVRAVGSS
jgi:hypothetical protein